MSLILQLQFWIVYQAQTLRLEEKNSAVFSMFALDLMGAVQCLWCDQFVCFNPLTLLTL